MIIVYLNNEQKYEFPDAVEAKPASPGFMGFYERDPDLANKLILAAQIKTKLITSLLYKD